MYPFLEDVNFHGSLASLAGRVNELEGFLEEEKKSFCEMDLVLEASSSSAQIIAMKPEEEKITRFK